MKILTIHADYINYESTKKAIKSAEDAEKGKQEVKDCLVVFTAVEKPDEADIEAISEKLKEEIENVAKQVNAKTIVLYPYAHLSSNLSNPETAVAVLKTTEKLLKDYKVYRAPFGWYKSFEIKNKGHPLSELSREFTIDTKKEKTEKHVFALEKKKLSDEDKVNYTTALIAAKAILAKHKGNIGLIGIKGETAFVDIDVKLNNADIPALEADIQALLKKEIAIKKGAAKDAEHFQKEILEDIKHAQVYSYEDLVVVPLHESPFAPTKNIKFCKIVELGGAYWRNNAGNKQLTRVYVVGFENDEAIKAFEQKKQEAALRDHRVIGKQMDLFSMQDEAPGMPFFHHNGTIIYNALIEYTTEELRKLNYEINKTPIILNKKLWLQSGHWDHYKDNMYFTKIDNQDFAVKPMNCPGNMLVFKSNVHSYKDLPIKAAEYGLVHRHELSGVLSGLFRVRAFTQDDAHVFCMQEQLEEQIIELIELIDRAYQKFGFAYSVELSTKPEKAMGDPKQWSIAEDTLEKALKKKKLAYKINPGDGAFYGPKIDFHIKDAIGRSWQCGTIQLDFFMPERFDLSYEGKDSKKHRPVMLHRTIYGSVERFMGVLIEHFAGKFPLWLSPVQVKIVTVTDRNIPFARQMLQEFLKQNIRVVLDDRTETIGKKVRDAQMEKVNYIVTIGDKEDASKALAIRTRTGEVQFNVSLSAFLEQLHQEIASRKI
ncbi:threonine--tRNA ligase [Candidatus Woesearchaeota archaeon]|nr:MAG: threonine--tRNA ligase [Candidatus Woesearchaeota archaeon]